MTLSFLRENPSPLEEAECPTELWWELAEKYPLTALESPLFPLLTLEGPARWLELEDRNIPTWIKQVAADPRVSFSLKRLFATDCAEHVLPLIERQYPRSRETIQAARDFALGKISEEQLQKARDVASASSSISWSAYWTVFANAYYSVERTVTAASSAATVQTDERRWQWRRLLQYLNLWPQLPPRMEGSL